MRWYHKGWYHIIRYDIISYDMISYDMIAAAAAAAETGSNNGKPIFSWILTLKNDIIKNMKKIKLHKTCR